ncbi:hypothetical protein [Cellulomonas sp. ATA003]|uniref:hypothetical protein n=1 Tax=Cellulomonas sp. ATA003 TaxID=3073064 RepID=UPI002873705B|nr:hypothetical protein [Cellulomonas sp. ATA003]WNB86476.1 hypothetical protein REH70_04365 [Cellulomonas sp. ATA003]
MSIDTRSRAQMIPARVVAVVLALFSAVILMGLIDLFTLPGWVDQSFVWEVPLEASWGSLFTFFLAGGYAWVAINPRAPWPALVQLAISGLALLVGATAGADWRPLALAVGVGVSALVLWRLVGRPAPEFGGRPSVHWAVLAVAALGVPLWWPYALTAFAQSRAGVLGSITQGIEHWPVQGAVGVAVVLGSLVLAIWDDGRPLLRVAVSLTAVYIGMAELAYPDRAGAMDDRLWGIGVTLWGLLIALVCVPRRVDETS